MGGSRNQRTPEERVIAVKTDSESKSERSKIDEATGRYLAAVLTKLDAIEYGDPSEFILARTGKLVRHSSLTEIWVPPTLRIHEEKNIERDVNALLSIHDQCALVLAPPGYGKSTLARYLTCTFAKQYQAGSFDRFAVYVPLSSLRLQGRTYQRAIVECALASVDIGLDETLMAQLEGDLKNATIIFDGLDELPVSQSADGLVPSRVQAAGLVRNVNIPNNEHFRTGPLSSIVTCRLSDYFDDSRSRIRPSTMFELSNFSPEQAKEAVKRWHETAERLSNEYELDAGNLPQRGMDIIAILGSNSELGAVCLTPLMLNILQTVYSDESGDLPSSVSQLCERAVRWLLIEKHAVGELKAFVDAYGDWILDAVSRAAFLVHERVVEGSSKSLSEDDLRAVARAASPDRVSGLSYEQREMLIMRVAAHMRRGHGILQPQRDGEYDFSHNVLREVLAGRALGALPTTEKRRFALNESWHAPIRYWAGIRASTEEGRYEINAFVGELRGGPGSRKIEAVLARGEMLSEVCAVAGGAPLMLDLRQRIAASQQELLRSLKKRDLSFARRLRIGDLLGVMGDPRLTPDVTERLYWISAGNKRLGRDKPHITRITKYKNVPAAPPVEGHLSRFALGIFPVTNAEYKQFIDDGGYQDKRFWPSEEGWAWVNGDEKVRSSLVELARQAAPIHLSSEILAERLVPEDFPDQCDRMIFRYQPMYWADPLHNRPNQPVVGVNWWEALAYCNWLNAHLHQTRKLDDAFCVRLPTEAEWESAAQDCSQGNCYLWSSGPPSENAHVRATETPNAEVQALRSSGVGLFTFFNPKLPLYDLVGNVWEWTASVAEPYSAKTFEQTVPISGLRDRIARGSSWLSSEIESAEITFRSFDPPYNAYEDLGLRICVAGNNS